MPVPKERLVGQISWFLLFKQTLIDNGIVLVSIETGPVPFFDVHDIRICRRFVRIRRNFFDELQIKYLRCWLALV